MSATIPSPSIPSPTFSDIKGLIPKKFEEKHIFLVIAVLLILFVVLLSKRKVPQSVLKLVDNILFDILMLLLVIYVAMKKEPIHAVIVAIAVCVVIISVKIYSNRYEPMSNLSDKSMGSIPKYSHSPDGRSFVPEDLVDHGEHGEKVSPSDGPVIGVTEAEMESLCMPLKDQLPDKNGKIIDNDFSELLNKEAVSQFAKHQYQNDVGKKFKLDEEVHGNIKPFSTLAPIS